jgi:hypothetical protein
MSTDIHAAAFVLPAFSAVAAATVAAAATRRQAVAVRATRAYATGLTATWQADALGTPVSKRTAATSFDPQSRGSSG